MEKLGNGIYRIFKNDELINKALQLIIKELPKCYTKKNDAYYETSNLLHEIIEDKSNKIDECVRDFDQGKQLELIFEVDCKIYLDTETERVIEQLFEREKAILDIKNENYIIIK